MTPRTLIALYKIAAADAPLSSAEQPHAVKTDAERQPEARDEGLVSAEQTSKPIAPTYEEMHANQRQAVQKDSDAQRAMTDPMALYKHVAKAMKHSGRIAQYVLKRSGYNKRS